MHRVLQDQGGRPYMEDTHFAIDNIIPGVHAYGIFDGHAGDQVAIFASKQFPIVLRELLTRNTNATLDNIMYVAFQLVVEMLPAAVGLQMGCTAVVVLQKGNQFVVANCGDSRAVMNDVNNAIAITEDHKPDRELQRIMDAGGFVTHNPMDVPRVNGSLAVSRSLGDFYLFPSVIWKPDIFSFNASPRNQYIVLATDGIWDAVSNEEMVALMNEQVHTQKPMEDAIDIAHSHALLLARKRGSVDNVTLLTVEINV